MYDSNRERRGLGRFVVHIPIILATFCTCLVSGCQPAASQPSAGECQLSFSPSPPVVGTVEVTARLFTAEGRALQGAKVKLEGNMNHAGMKPSFGDLEETDAGVYRGDLQFTMGGDWFVIVTATGADGLRIEHQIDVPGVAVP